ncbi:MAG TPA: hypothetical protein VGH53_21475 [Streptosporangiaceae bacterium]
MPTLPFVADERARLDSSVVPAARARLVSRQTPRNLLGPQANPEYPARSTVLVLPMTRYLSKRGV